MAVAARPRIGQLVFVPVNVKPGMFPSERKFYGDVLGIIISGFAQQDQIVENSRLVAVVIAVSSTTATIALQGEVAQAKVLDVPFSFVREHASTT